MHPTQIPRPGASRTTGTVAPGQRPPAPVPPVKRRGGPPRKLDARYWREAHQHLDALTQMLDRTRGDELFRALAHAGLTTGGMDRVIMGVYELANLIAKLAEEGGAAC